MKKLFLCLILLVVSLDMLAQHHFDVTAYGARKDSVLSTSAIKKAIAAAVKAGGGTVYFPPGKYLTGPIRLESNITVEIDAGAVVNFSDNFDDYLPMVPSRWEGTTVMNFSPLFYAYKAENITIRGRGKINGNGKKWWDYYFKVAGNQQPRSRWQELFATANKDRPRPDDPAQFDRGFMRPPFIQPMYCKNVLIEGITIVNSPFWTVNPEFCENVTITGVTINNPPSPNTDGINPESCKYVHISNCHISVGDDCITIKSGKDSDGRRLAAPAENYTITNCTMLSGHGGVVIGSEMSGGVKKIAISNCIFDGTDRGIRIKTTRGRGGVVEDITVDNVVMKNIRDQAFVLDMAYTKTQPEPVSERTPRFRNIRFSDIIAETNQAGLINGLAEMPVEGLVFSNVRVQAKTGFVIREARDVAFHHVQIDVGSGPSVIAEKASLLTFDDVKSAKPLPATPLITLEHVENVFVYNAFPAPGTPIYVQAKGSTVKNVVMKNNHFGSTAPFSGDPSVKQEVKID